MVRPLLTTEQREDLIRCISTPGYEVELYLVLQKLEWMNHSTYMLAACDNAIRSEGFPYSENMITLFENWYEFAEASRHVVLMADITFIHNCLDCAEHCSDKMLQAIVLGKLFQYLIEHPAILHRSKHFRRTVLERAADVHLLATKQKNAITDAAAEEGGVMDHTRYDEAFELQGIIMNLIDLPIFH